jgi:arginase family enzyme
MPEDEPVAVKLLGVPYDAHSSFLLGPALAPSAIRAALTCGSANWCTESGLDLDPATNDGWTDLGDLELPDGAADAVQLIHRGAADAMADGSP